MSKLIKILIISHAFVQEVNHRRWRRLAQDKEYEVHLLVPKYWESRWFSEKTVFTPEAVHDDNFYVHPMSTTSVRNWVKYCFKSLDGKFRQIKPDLIYIIHEESTLIHHQIYLYRKIFAPKAKIIFFSMNAMGVPYQLQKNPLKRAVLKMQKFHLM